MVWLLLSGLIVATTVLWHCTLGLDFVYRVLYKQLLWYYILWLNYWTAVLLNFSELSAILNMGNRIIGALPCIRNTSWVFFRGDSKDFFFCWGGGSLPPWPPEWNPHYHDIRQLIHKYLHTVVLCVRHIIYCTSIVTRLYADSELLIQIDRDEVSIRRVIGAKKDSYYLDKKHVT